MYVSLKEYVESRIESLEKATTLARAELERRLEGMNEFRSQLENQTRTFVSKDESSLRYEQTCNRLRDLESFRDKMEGKADQRSVTNALIVAFSGIAISVASLVIAIIS